MVNKIQDVLDVFNKDNSVEVVDLTSYDDCEIMVKLDDMSWLEVTPIFDETDLEVVVTHNDNIVASSSCEKITISSSQGIGKDTFENWITEVQVPFIKSIWLHDTYVEFKTD